MVRITSQNLLQQLKNNEVFFVRLSCIHRETLYGKLGRNKLPQLVFVRNTYENAAGNE
jgi:hypothetical protein